MTPPLLHHALGHDPFALHAGLRYVPPTAFEEYQGLSDKALVYLPNLDLRNRMLVIGEAAGLAEGNGRALLRQLLTENAVRYGTVGQTSDGYGGRELSVNGPVGVLMTTTKAQLHPEDETRFLSLHVDQSPEQYRRFLMMLGGSRPSRPPEEELSRWHALHEYVCSGTLDVEIPFEKPLLSRMPPQGRAVRDASKLLALIRAHALLHQLRRKRNEKGEVIATLQDYYMVHGLVAEPLSQGLQAGVPDHVRRVTDAVIKYYENTKDALTITELAKMIGRDVGTTDRHVWAAIGDRYLENLNPGQGKSAKLVPGERELPHGTALPDPKELIELFGESDDAPDATGLTYQQLGGTLSPNEEQATIGEPGEIERASI